MEVGAWQDYEGLRAALHVEGMGSPRHRLVIVGGLPGLVRCARPDRGHFNPGPNRQGNRGVGEGRTR